MAAPKVVTAQRDFSAGEVDPELKRDDERPEFKAGLRQCANYRILNSRKLTNRPGRRALFIESGRVDEILMNGLVFYLCFGQGTLRVYNSAGTQVYGDAGRPWVTGTAYLVRWAVADLSVYITFTGRPQVLTYNAAAGIWSAAPYVETVTGGSQKRTPFYRISPKGVTMQPAALVGNGIGCVFSAGMNLTAGHVGTRLRFCERQVQITAVADATHCTIDIKEPLPGAQGMAFATDPTLKFNIGDEVQGTVTNSIGLVTQINGGAMTMVVQLLSVNTSNVSATIFRGNIIDSSTLAFTTADTVTGVGGALVPTAVTPVVAPNPILVWDDEVMNDLRGYPASVSYDQNRLIFCNFPSVPNGICWSWIGLPNDLYVGSNPSAAIFEPAPEKATVYDVVAGPEGSEFVFTDRRLWYIPISETNPLKPGSVAFKLISGDGCGNVRPQMAGDFVVYINAGLKRVSAAVPIGAYNRSYTSRDISELHTHLFAGPIAIAAPNGDGDFPERYVYVLNAGGQKSIAVAKLPTVEGLINLQGVIGWTPWTGSGQTRWVSARAGNVLFTTDNVGTSLWMVEQLDNTRYLDASILVNSVPTGLPIPPGKGPLWWIPNALLGLMDQGRRMMGTYQIDANGFIVPQNLGGEDLTSPTLVAGTAWTATAEPFLPAAGPGQSVDQRMNTRETDQTTVYVMNSTGFLFADLKSGLTTVTGPALGAVIQSKRITAWNQDDDATLAPPLREHAYEFKSQGRDYDPRCAVIKDTPGPLTILEVARKVSV